ncbi:MAG: IclR family transcriptional regulator [Chloroflexi bacterium]|nr:IclR family transcriptional regulator [Chloroflexota bacterium]
MTSAADGVPRRGRPTHAVRHAAAVLGTFSVAEPFLGVNEIARRVGLNRSTVSRLLQTLQELGFVACHEPTGRYRLGLRIAELAGIALAGLDLRDVAQVHLRRLNLITRETINLAVWDTDAAVIIDHCPGLEPIKALGWVGRRHPGHCTSVGKVLLAFSDEPDRLAPTSDALQTYTSRTVTDPERLQLELEEVRRTGLGVNRAEFQDGLNALAAPVWNHESRVQAAVGLAGPAYRLTDTQIAELTPRVQETALAISRELGAPSHVAPWTSERHEPILTPAVMAP